MLDLCLRRSVFGVVLLAAASCVFASPLPQNTLHGNSQHVNPHRLIEHWSATAAMHSSKLQDLGEAAEASFPSYETLKDAANQKAASQAAVVLQGGTSLPAAEGVFSGPGLGSGSGVPPDSNLAAGPNHVVVVVNNILAIYDKTGALITTQHFNQFFSGFGIAGTIFDPRVIYDEADGRFIIVQSEADFSGFTNAHLFVAVSQSSDPTGSWYKYSVNVLGSTSGGAATWRDFPTLGLSSTGLFISTGEFDFATESFQQTWLTAIALSDLLAGNASLSVVNYQDVPTASGAQAAVIQPAVTYGVSPYEFLATLEYASPGALMTVYAIDNSNLSSMTLKAVPVPVYSMPPNALQPGTTTRIDTNDLRLLGAVWRNGALWTAHSEADATGAASVVRWYDVTATTPSNPVLAGSGAELGAGFAYFPAINVLPSGDMALAFNTSSSSQFVSVAYMYRGAGDAAGAKRAYQTYQAGSATYTGYQQRWGDYSGNAPDPDGTRLWVVGEYALAPNPNFGTAVNQLNSPVGVLFSPAAMAFSDQGVGTSSAPNSVTLSNTGTASVTVSSVTLAGVSPSSFSVTADNCTGTSLAPQATCSVILVFQPTTIGLLSANLTFALSGMSPQLYQVVGAGTKPAASLSPTSLSFGSQAVGQPSASQTIALSSNGSGDLGISSISTSGDFSQTNNCGSTLGAGLTCSINVTFKPTISGTRTGTLTVSDDAANSPQTASLSGSGTAPVVLSSTSLSLGSVVVNTTSPAKSVTLTNNQAVSLTVSSITASGDFHVQSTTCSTVAAKGSCTIGITFTPTALGTRKGSLTITDSANTSPQSVSLSGAGLAPIAASPASLSFGYVIRNTTSNAMVVKFTNNQATAAAISGIATSGDFAVQSTTCGATLSPGASCTVAVTFTPTALSTRKGALTMTDDAPNSPQTVPLAGSGVLPVALSVATLSFGNQEVNTTSVAKSVTLTNYQAVALHVSSLTASGDYHVQSTTCATVASKGTCSISVTFLPVALGTRPGTLQVNDDGPNNPQTVALTGSGVLPVTLSASKLSFSNQEINTTSTAKSVTVTNNQAVVLHVSSVTASGDFHIQSNTCATVASKATCSISVNFTPTALGTRTGTLQVNDDAPNTPQTAALTGGGVTPVALSATKLSFPGQAVNTTSAVKNITLTNYQSVVLNIASISATGDYQVPSKTCGGTLAAKASCTISVTFTPTALGTRTGTLQVNDDGPNSPQTAALSGSGMAPVTLSATTLSFGSVAVNTTSAAKSVTVYNNQSVALNIASLAASGDFQVQSTTCSATLASHGTCTVNVTFTPTATGTRTGKLTITDDANNSPQIASLAGSGV